MLETPVCRRLGRAWRPVVSRRTESRVFGGSDYTYGPWDCAEGLKISLS